MQTAAAATECCRVVVGDESTDEPCLTRADVVTADFGSADNAVEGLAGAPVVSGGTAALATFEADNTLFATDFESVGDVVLGDATLPTDC